MHPVITCRTLGPVQVSIDGQRPPPQLLWRKPLALLIYLARSPRRARSREHLVNLLWCDKEEAAARHSLNEALRILRRAAGDAAVETEGGQVRLASGLVDLDTDRLESHIDAREWSAAAALVEGEFLEGFGIPDASDFEDWLGNERALWRRQSVTALVGLAETQLGRGAVDVAVHSADRGLRLEPGSDLAIRALMKGMALAGNCSGALERYDRFVRGLEEGLGATPHAETQALASRIRRERVWLLPTLAREPEAAHPRRTPLIGRDLELERIISAWSNASAGSVATCALVLADPGMGKTRLLDEVLSRARLDGASVVTVRGVEADAAEPWSGVTGLTRGGLLRAGGIAAAAPEALAAFATRDPEWMERFASAVRGVEPERPGRALREILRAATDEQPVCLAIDDAHWLDRDSLLALAAVLRDLAAAPLFLLLSAAPTPAREELDDLRTRLGRDLPGVSIALGPLDAEGLNALSRWMLPAYGDEAIDRVVRRVAADSAGLPLLAVELLSAVRLGMDLQGGPSPWPEPLRTLDQSLPGSLPDAVIAAIRVGFRRLSAGAQRALIAAAVAGGRVSPQLIGRGAGLEGESLASALDELEWTRWLTAEARGYAFTARVVGDVVARDLVIPGQRQRLLQAMGIPGVT